MESDGYEPMFPAGQMPQNADAQAAEAVPQRNFQKRKNTQEEEMPRKRAYSVFVGPKFRRGHETPFRATNLQMINARGSSKRLLANVVKEIDEGISFSDDCDVVLNTFVHPESPKLITIKLSSIDSDSILDSITGSVLVPLYLSLVDLQWDDVKNQYGIDDEEGAWSVEMNRGRAISSASGSSSMGSAGSLESFVNEVMGRFGRYNVSNETTWDKSHKFFQPIDFKIRIGPQFKYSYDGLDGVRRGQAKETNKGFKVPTAAVGQPASKQVGLHEETPFADQIEKYDENKLHGESEIKRLENQSNPTAEEKSELKMWKNIKKQSEEIEDLRENEYFENGLDQAAVPEHKFRMTSHMALSPSFRSAISQAMSYLGDAAPRSKAGFEATFLKRSETRTHLATIVESELKETDVSITRYQDPQALAAVRKKKTYAAYMLKKILGNN